MTAIELLKQEPRQRIEPTAQILLLSLLYTSFFDNKDIEFVKNNKNKIINYLKDSPEFQLIRERSLTIDLPTLLDNVKANLNGLEKLCQQSPK